MGARHGETLAKTRPTKELHIRRNCNARRWPDSGLGGPLGPRFPSNSRRASRSSIPVQAGVRPGAQHGHRVASHHGDAGWTRNSSRCCEGADGTGVCRMRRLSSPSGTTCGPRRRRYRRRGVRSFLAHPSCSNQLVLPLSWLPGSPSASRADTRRGWDAADSPPPCRPFRGVRLARRKDRHRVDQPTRALSETVGDRNDSHLARIALTRGRKLSRYSRAMGS